MWQPCSCPRYRCHSAGAPPPGPGGWSPAAATFNLSTRQAIGRSVAWPGASSMLAMPGMLPVVIPGLRRTGGCVPSMLPGWRRLTWRRWPTPPGGCPAGRVDRRRRRAYADYAAAGENPRAAFCAGHQPAKKGLLAMTNDRIVTEADVVTKFSHQPVPDTVAKLTGMITAKGMKLFAVIDQAAEARQV